MENNTTDINKTNNHYSPNVHLSSDIPFFYIVIGAFNIIFGGHNIMFSGFICMFVVFA